jgi:predicted nucleic acid-binding protein
LTELVLDASVVLRWFGDREEANGTQAMALRAEYEAGDLTVTVPPLLGLEVVNMAGRRWGWAESSLLELVAGIGALGFDWREPGLDNVARWTAAGLSAYDAAYVALAEEIRTVVVTDDRTMADAAPRVVRRLSTWLSGSP